MGKTLDAIEQRAYERGYRDALRTPILEAVARMRVIEAARQVDIDNGPIPTDEECPALGIDPADLINVRNLRAAVEAL